LRSAGDAYRVELLTPARVGEFLRARPAVILPLGGCEPFGGAAALGVEALCAGGVSRELSERCRILSAPVIPFGCSTPFISFPGAFGVKPRTFVNMLCEFAGAYIFQGATRVLAVSAAPFNRAPALEAFKRVEAKHGGVRAMLFDINRIAGGADAVARVVPGNPDTRVDREDAALLAMAAYLSGGAPDASAVGVRGRVNERGNAGVDEYIRWRKRGADPQKLRKLFPNGLLLPKDGGGEIDVSPERGKEVFERVVGVIEAEINQNL
jgi:hypothetical protein